MGQRFRRNFHLAMAHYEAAAQKGHADAENNLGSLYEHGKGVKKNLQQAAQWYLAAANQGHVIAQCNLASLYFVGRGVERDYLQCEKDRTQLVMPHFQFS